MKRSTADTLQIKDILDEYKEDTDIFTEEPERIKKIKNIIWNLLTETERRIILLYAERGSMRKVAKELRCSASTVYIEIAKIRTKIKEGLNE